MSLFNSSRGFAGLGSVASKPLDPAADIARLLNQHAHHWQTLEKEIKEVKAKQEAAQGAYAAALEAKQVALSEMVTAEQQLAGAEADCLQRRAELDSSQATNGRLLGEVEALKEEVAGVTSVADQARQAFTEQVAALMAALTQLREAHPGCFITAGPPTPQ